MATVSTHYLRASIHGRYLLRMPAGSVPAGLLVGFHGYGETAEDEMERLSSISCNRSWCLCSIEALHRFRNVKGRPGASWMTSSERELRISENVGYVDAVLNNVFRQCGSSPVPVLHGFSQGAGMACRSALLGMFDVAGVMLLGGDIPPELVDLKLMRAVHIGRGDHDHLYTQKRCEADTARLQAAGLDPAVTLFRGGHMPTGEYFEAAGRFLDGMRLKHGAGRCDADS